MIKAGIIGGTGYTAGELIRLLLWHPKVELTFVHSKSQSGKFISEIHTDLMGETSLQFVDTLQQVVDVVFLCLPHGATKDFLQKHSFTQQTKIIDLSNDFRIKSKEHSFIYGLPELNKSLIRTTNRIANCGCFATAIQLAILPLAEKKALYADLHIHAITGSTGAGKQPGSTTHFSWRNNNVSVYKAFHHQHLGEISQSIKKLQPSFEQDINFIPVRGNFSRGIFCSTYTKTTQSLSTIKAWYQDYYQNDPFVFVTDKNPDLKQVINTNKCILYLEKHENKLLIISALDNLLKGASGQAVQNMNLLFQLEETCGLQLKANVF